MTQTSDETTGTPPMIGRRLDIPQWLAYVAGYDFGTIEPSKIVLHHTWKPTVAEWRGLRSMQGMQTYYRGLGWTAAPHIYVAPDGIWLFTPMHTVGIHAGANNGSVRQGWYSIGVEMVGDYDKSRPSGAVWEHTQAVLIGLARRLGRSVSALLAFHRETSTKSCPGWAVTKDWVIAECRRWEEAHPGATTPPRPAARPYTADSPLLGPSRISPAQARAFLTRGPHGEYTAGEIESPILSTYWQLCNETGLDFTLAIAQMSHETGNLTSFWAARPQRNPAGIGVNGKRQAARPGRMTFGGSPP